MRRTLLRHEHVFVLSDVHCAGDDQVLAVGADACRGVRDRAVLRPASNRLRPDRGSALTAADMLERLGLVL